MNRLALSALMIATTCSLSQLSHGDFYMGAAAGSTDYAIGREDVTSLELTAGYRIGENFAVEASWLELGEQSIPITETFDADFGVDGMHFSFLAIAPLAPDFEVFGRFGVYHWDLESSNTTTSAIIRSNDREDNSDLVYGAGAAWHLSDTVALRVMYQEVDVRGDNIENISAGFTFAF